MLNVFRQGMRQIAIQQNLMSVYFFSKKTRPLKSEKPIKQKTTSRAFSDDKSAKISQAEQEQEQKKAQEEIKRKQQLVEARRTQPKLKTWDAMYDEQVDEQDLFKVKQQKFPIYYQNRKILHTKKPPNTQVQYDLNHNFDGNRRLKNKVVLKQWNVVDQINRQFYKQLKLNNYDTDPFAQPQRCGAIGVKVGMTSLWDKWGHRHALTVVQLDRNQVIQVKTAELDGYNALQIGAGEANIKSITKPLLGHFLKHSIPLKKYIHEFNVTKENLLPVGFMLSVRHFTPGQLVDVKGVSNGKGFSGTIKRWNFNRQPTSHGNSLSHRVLGSTGNRADPGRVFKGKKMPGRLGGEKKTVECLKVYKIDFERQVILLKGSVPGKAGSILYLRDSIKKADKNQELLNYPTFIVNEESDLATQITMPPPDDDPESREVHDNDVIKGDEED